ncbi:hypothetical protein [Paenibacillus alginolyticus]|uniref:SH3b domain-containing protein n=1 Tax=Paenibacillus alginolyticus TaxID=59839 RepID=A0ABT4GJX5_9BACL|nr:hypothetical protein [Paenibacillus alginolyticus]MCY9696496.1 hypothetical protein [Paenibacillus alginolyticus]MEC0141927.1 hypothetical protein [Paenibacillus alginolyticus]
MIKMKLIAITILAAGLGLGSLAHQSKAETIYGGSYAPEGIRFPSTIELLAETPYYADPNQPDDEPEGTFAPQEVNVLTVESSWSSGRSIWKIETMFGPRWIRPNPWEIDMEPPKRITLLEETPLYRSKSTKGEPAASLSAQEVEVVAADKQWFYTNDPSSKAWIKVHTTWLGDLWAHIPVNQIGTVHKVQRKAHYYGLPANSDLSTAMGFGEQKLDWSNSKAGDYTIAREFTTIYDRAFEIQTDQGTTWTREKGVTILSANETIAIVRETPLIHDVWDGYKKEDAVIKGETVTAFEKIEERLESGRGPYSIWNNSTWYHVRSSKGTGWINKLFGEPESAIPVHWKVAVNDQKELFRYPEIPFSSSTLLLRDQTVEATGAWNGPNGGLWLKVHVDGRSGWIPFWNYSQDKIWDEDTNTIFHISKTNTNSLGIAPAANGGLQINNGGRIGYMEKEQSYLDAILLAEQFQYKVEMVKGRDAVTFSKADYSFELNAGDRNALISWHGTKDKSVQLAEMPRHTRDSWYLNLKDVQTLFGITQVFAGSEFSLFEKVYHVRLGELPTSAAKGRLELQAFVDDWTSREDYKSDQMPLQMFIEENGDHGGEGHLSQINGIVNDPDASVAPVTLFSLKASRPLAIGTHQLSVVIRIGERIIWKQNVEIVVK